MKDFASSKDYTPFAMKDGFLYVYKYIGDGEQSYNLPSLELMDVLRAFFIESGQMNRMAAGPARNQKERGREA